MYPVDWEDASTQQDASRMSEGNRHEDYYQHAELEPFSDRILNFFMNTNCLYFLSAFLLLLGAYLMINSDILSQDHIIKSYQIFSIIQGYELALIVIFLFVMRKLKVPEDSMILAGIEILLFLDPLFFNNIFYTRGIANGLTFGFLGMFLLLVKFLVVFQFGRLPMIPRLNGALFMTAGFVYFYPAALDKALVGIFNETSFYMLCWIPLFITMILPDRSAIKPPPDTDTSVSPGQRKSFFVAVSLVLMYIVFSNLFWTRGIFEITMHGLHFSPFLVGLCMLALKLKPDWMETRYGEPVVWLSSIAAVLLSLSRFAVEYTLALGPVELSSLSVALLGVTYLHYYLWRKTGEDRHVGAGLACLTLLFTGPHPQAIWSNLSSLHAPPYMFLTLVITYLAWKQKSRMLVFLAGVFLMLSVFGGFSLHQQEFGPFILAHALVYWGIFMLTICKYDKDYLVRSLLLLGLISHTLLNTGPAEADAFYNLYFWFETLVFFGLGCFFSVPSYFVIAGGSMALRMSLLFKARLITYVKAVPRGMSSGVILVVLSFFVLGLGVMVSIHKSRRRDEGGPPPDPAGPGPDPAESEAGHALA